MSTRQLISKQSTVDPDAFVLLDELLPEFVIDQSVLLALWERLSYEALEDVVQLYKSTARRTGQLCVSVLGFREVLQQSWLHSKHVSRCITSQILFRVRRHIPWRWTWWCCRVCSAGVKWELTLFEIKLVFSNSTNSFDSAIASSVILCIS